MAATFGALTANRNYVNSGDFGVKTLRDFGKIQFVSTPIKMSEAESPEALTNLRKEQGGVEVLS
ncbi:MAG: hypothetical protein NC200_03740 [Candidatus Gastranaerophilales bacterium]|nr:hypothetical protein [Candidatus Gastranaerophilales bacterium]